MSTPLTHTESIEKPKILEAREAASGQNGKNERRKATREHVSQSCCKLTQAATGLHVLSQVLLQGDPGSTHPMCDDQLGLELLPGSCFRLAFSCGV